MTFPTLRSLKALQEASSLLLSTRLLHSYWSNVRLQRIKLSIMWKGECEEVLSTKGEKQSTQPAWLKVIVSSISLMIGAIGSQNLLPLQMNLLPMESGWKEDESSCKWKGLSNPSPKRISPNPPHVMLLFKKKSMFWNTLTRRMTLTPKWRKWNNKSSKWRNWWKIRTSK